MDVWSLTKPSGWISWPRTRSTRRMKAFSLGSEVSFWERFPGLFCPGWWHGSAGRQDRRGMLLTLGRAVLPAAITTNVNGHHQPFWWDTRATLGYKEAQLRHPEDRKTTGHGILAFRYWLFFSTGGWSNLTSPHKSLSSWKMSTILFCRTCFQPGGVCTKRSVLHQQATYYLAENSTSQPCLKADLE